MRTDEVPVSARVVQSARSYTPLEMVASPIFWVMYIMFVLVPPQAGFRICAKSLLEIDPVVRLTS